jgi:shikimate kinase
VLTYVLGAPGSGKTTVAPILRRLLRDFVVLDWDAYMRAASELAGRDVRRDPSTWPSYRQLLRSVIDSVHPSPLVVLGVCTPDELAGWPIETWMLLDCSDDERRRRLLADFDAAEVEDALTDAARYRDLELPVIDTTDRTPESVAEELARAIRRQAR